MPPSTPSPIDLRTWISLEAFARRPDPPARRLLARIAPDGPLAPLREALTELGPQLPPRPGAAPPHPSWHAHALASLPPAAARAYLDRLDPAEARRAAPHATLRATPCDPISPLAAILASRAHPGPFPHPPAWASPTGDPQTTAEAAQGDAWPLPEAWVPRADHLTGAVEPGSPLARFLGRLALALLYRPDDAWGLAGAWPSPVGGALLSARRTASVRFAALADARPVSEALFGFAGSRWIAWAT